MEFLDFMGMAHDLLNSGEVVQQVVPVRHRPPSRVETLMENLAAGASSWPSPLRPTGMIIVTPKRIILAEIATNGLLRQSLRATHECTLRRNATILLEDQGRWGRHVGHWLAIGTERRWIDTDELTGRPWVPGVPHVIPDDL